MLKWLVSVKPRGSSESDTESAQEAIIGPPSSPSPSPENCSSENDPNSAKSYGLSKTTLTTKAKSFISPTMETIVTDDPLAALEKSISQSATGSTWSKPRLSSPFKKKQEQIYSVTRVNPLFYEIDEEFQPQQHPKEAFLPMSASPASRFESQWSSVDPDCAKLEPPTQILPSMPGSPGKTASSSGYESLSREPHLIASSHNSPQSRFPLVPARSSNLISKSAGSTPATNAVAKPAYHNSEKQAIGLGRAQIVHQNTDYLVKIQMASEIPAPKTQLVSSQYELMSLPPSQPVPRPIWPGVPDKDQYHIPRVKSPCTAHHLNAATLKKLDENVIVQHNARYVTDIRVVQTPSMHPSHSDLLRQTSDESSSMSPAARGSSYPFPPLYLPEAGIPPDSLLTNFPTMLEDHTDSLEHTELEGTVFRRNDAVLREFSEKLSQRRHLNKVSRAFSSSGASNSHYGYLHRVDPESVQEPMKLSDATHFAKKVSAFKELWEKSGMRSNGRRLLIESDDDEEKQVLSAKRRALQEELGTDSGLSSPSFRFGLVDERQTSANSFSFNPVHLPRPAGVGLANSRSWDADRLSNSSRSSSSRRVTFSADTVDNEQSNPSLVPSLPTKTSITTGTESASTAKAEELQLTPKFLPNPYKEHYEAKYHPAAYVNGGAYKSHYTNNIVLYGTANKAISVENGCSVPKTGIDVLPRYSLTRSHSSQAVTVERPQKTWDTYYGTAKHPILPGITNNTVLTPAKTRLEKNALLHPNYGAACPDLDLCVDFTVDTQQPKSVSHKIVNRLCCSVMVLLGVGVFIVVVVGLSMYLTEGRRVFGPI